MTFYLKVSDTRTYGACALVSPATAKKMGDNMEISDPSSSRPISYEVDNAVKDGWVRLPQAWAASLKMFDVIAVTPRLDPVATTPTPPNSMAAYFDPNDPKRFESPNPWEINEFGKAAMQHEGSLIVHTNFRATWIPPYKHEK